MARSIWVIAEDFGPEGLKEPFMAFLEEAEAKQCMELLGKPLAGTSAKLIKVPLWMSDATRDVFGFMDDGIAPVAIDTDNDCAP